MSKKDKRLEGDIIKRIRRDSCINDAMIDVRVRDGHVLLTGKELILARIGAVCCFAYLVENQLEMRSWREQNSS